MIACKRAILAMSKSAWPEGRIGRADEQDWYLVVKEAVRLYKQGSKDDVILAITGFNGPELKHPEIYYYRQTLVGFGLIEGSDFLIFPEGTDTLTQLGVAVRFAKDHSMKLVVVSTKLHVLRIKWICFWDKISALNVTPPELGIPRRKEILNDIVMTILHPFIDMFRLRPTYLELLAKRRAKGKL